MKSSYEKNNYGEVFELITRACYPKIVVELGVLHGYSTYHICKGIEFLKHNYRADCTFDAYDLFEDYPYNHSRQEDVRKMLDDNGFKDTVTLHKEDAFEAYKNYKDESVYLLHVDLSNTGETLKKIMEQWDKKMVHDGVILFEGGSIERDNVEWMLKYNAPSIRKELRENTIINKGVGWYAVGTYNKFPSLTVLYKRFDEKHTP